jgi:hypothetical protein
MVSKSHPVPSSSLGKCAALLATALLALAVFAGSAQACSYSGAEKVFSPWGDQRHYVLAPDGGFEAGASGWQLNRGAAVVEGNESYYLNDAADSKSLSLPAGSSAVSPPVCMSIDTPSFRLVARNTGAPSARLRVEASYTLSTVVGLLIPSAIEIRFTPLDAAGRWQVDDVYIDPFRRS